MTRIVVIVVSIILIIWLAACGSTEPPPNIEETVVAAVAATVASLPTQPPPEIPPEPTAYPTYTPFPTYTPYPTPEPVVIIEAPTNTPTLEPTQPPTPLPSPTAVLSPTAVAAAVAAPVVAPSQPISTAIRAKDNAEVVFVPAGEFLMGASDADLGRVGAGGPPKLAGRDEQPQHPVTVEAFWIDKTEVSNAQFSDFVNLTGYKTTAELEGYGTSNGEDIQGATFYHPRGLDTGIDDVPDHPVVQVSWQDAKTYCEWVGARLPTEAEWEKAAKGDANDRIFPWGNAFQLPEFDVSTVTNFCSDSCPQEGKDPNVDDGYAYTAPVDSFPAGASPYGALNMAGNVWEWVDGAYLGYPGNVYELPETFDESSKVVRGGSWDNAAQHLRATFRQNNEPRLRSAGTGFRCAISDTDFVPAGAMAEPIVEPTTEPTAEPTSEPTTEPTSEPTAEPAEAGGEGNGTPANENEATGTEPTIEPTNEPDGEATPVPDTGG